MPQLIWIIFSLSIWQAATQDAAEQSGQCVFPNGDFGHCLPLENCPQVKSVIESQSQLQSIAYFLTKFQCGRDTMKINVCCPRQSVDGKEMGRMRCDDPHGYSGECLPIRDCQAALNLVKNNGTDQLTRDFLRKAVCGVENEEPKICCHDDLEKSAANMIENLKRRFDLSFAPAPMNVKIQELKVVATEANRSPTLHSKKLPGSEYCGSREPFDHGIAHVVNGVNATLAEWPWMVALGYEPNRGNKPVFKCAGTLISIQHILTAAHCVQPKRKKLIIARIGDLNLYEETDGADPIDAKIAKMIPHEQYDAASQTNDIALLVLEEAVKLSGNIRPICLPLTAELRRKDYKYEYLQVAGWGATSTGGSKSATLQDAIVQFVSEAQCKSAYSRFPKLIIDQRVVCAGNIVPGSADTCTGDSGGPIMNGDEPFYQVGIVSYGHDCAKSGYPGIYTKVSHYMDWIMSKVESTTSKGN